MKPQPKDRRCQSLSPLNVSLLASFIFDCKKIIYTNKYVDESELLKIRMYFLIYWPIRSKYILL